jgi:hypothetical protein
MVLDLPYDARFGPFSVALRWSPDVASGTQADSGLGAFTSSTGAVLGTLRYYAADRTIRWEVSPFTLSSAPLSFGAGAELAVILELGPGTDATLTTPSGSVTGAVGIGTPGGLSVGQVGITTAGSGFGEGGFGEGGFGGGYSGTATLAGGLIDNVMVFSRTLSAAERSNLVAATQALTGLPSPESDLALYVPFDVNPVLLGSAFSGGICHESTADGGGTRVTDSNGLTKALLSLDTGATKAPGLALRRTGPSWEVAASVVTAASYDNLSDHLAQYAAINYQELWVQ